MVKIQVNSEGKAYLTSAGKVLVAPESGGGGGILTEVSMWKEYNGSSLIIDHFPNLHYIVVFPSDYNSSAGSDEFYKSTGILLLDEDMDDYNAVYPYDLICVIEPYYCYKSPPSGEEKGDFILTLQEPSGAGSTFMTHIDL